MYFICYVACAGSIASFPWTVPFKSSVQMDEFYYYYDCYYRIHNNHNMPFHYLFFPFFFFFFVHMTALEEERDMIPRIKTGMSFIRSFVNQSVRWR